MRNVITNYLDDCVGCNRCIRACPVDEANIVWAEADGSIKVKVDNSKCIACGACLSACQHGSRHYEDDTERFFKDLMSGAPISVFAAPAIKSNFKDWEQLFTWLRSLGVKFIYDVSLGADICTWGHIRYIQQNGPKPIISQPCPAIVNYILMHRKELLKYLSPVQSPMMCTAIHMRKYERVGTKIAALSPCVAKTYEFEGNNNIVDYNVTFKKLRKYIEKNKIALPANGSGFDSYNAGLGSLYPMPGGLKECVEHYVGKSLRVDKSEGQSIVYKALDEYVKKPLSKLPVLFDVLNCIEGCNAGTGCVHEDTDIFEINTKMNELRQEAIKDDSQYLDELFKKFDETFKLDDFIRHYSSIPVRSIPITNADIDKAFIALGKNDETSRKFNCGACGSDTCLEMAIKVAKKVNIPENCMQKMHQEVIEEHTEAKDIMKNFLSSSEVVYNETSAIKEMTDEIVANMSDVTSAVASYDRMILDIERISEKVNIIALNASVEAAKAGQNGLAFGVVAKEIRNLAQSSADSAMRTKKAAEKANGAIDTVNKMMLEIDEKIRSSSDTISSILESTEKIYKE